MIKWKDKRSVNLLTIFLYPTITTDVIRKDKDGNLTSVPCPLDISIYNRLMNCKDRLYQLKGTFERDRKAKKWWHKVFWYFIDVVSVVNAYAIYREMNLPKLSLKDFRRDIFRDFTSSTYVTLNNKHQAASRSVQIMNKRPYAWRVLPTSQKDPREDDEVFTAQKQSKFVQNGCVVSAKFHSA
ncbi:piggyBac transposable element-derived protein 2 [Trichonephila clavipes]|nr:piggyBac transposable element-derived protein 2 [Trichonephila clavipes]